MNEEVTEEERRTERGEKNRALGRKVKRNHGC